MVKIVTEGVAVSCREEDHSFKALIKPHSFVEADLPHVWLLSPDIGVCARCRALQVEDVPLLHRVVLACLVQKPRQITVVEANYVRRLLKVTTTLFAGTLGYSRKEWEENIPRGADLMPREDEVLRLRILTALNQSGALAMLRERMPVLYQPADADGRGPSETLNLLIIGGADFKPTQFQWTTETVASMRKR